MFPSTFSDVILQTALKNPVSGILDAETSTNSKHTLPTGEAEPLLSPQLYILFQMCVLQPILTKPTSFFGSTKLYCKLLSIFFI